LDDDFVSAARRLGADESKERFEKKPKKIAKASLQRFEHEPAIKNDAD
jgi:hypothetical protein